MDGLVAAKGFRSFLAIIICIIGLPFVIVTSGIAWIIDDDTIESHHRIEPEIKVIENDTIFIYREP